MAVTYHKPCATRLGYSIPCPNCSLSSDNYVLLTLTEFDSLAIELDQGKTKRGLIH